MRFKYLIVGNSAAGIGAAEAIRANDDSGSLLIISEEEHHVYSRPMLGHYLTGKVALEDMLYRPVDFYKDNDISRMLGRKVIELDPRGKQVSLEDGKKIEYERIMLATGGRPFMPKMKGIGKNGVFTFSSLSDTKAVRSWIERGSPRVAVVLGGGFAGIQAAEALASLGIDVAIVELAERILGQVLDPLTSSMVKQAVERNNISIVNGHTVTEIIGNDMVNEVQLDDGRRLPCDLLVVAIGIVPNVQLAEMAGVKVRKGILVDARMQTSLTDIFAAGDCAEPFDSSSGSYRHVPIWPAACAGGRVAGFNMAGSYKEYEGTAFMNSMSLFGLHIISMGKSNIEKEEGFQVLRRFDVDKEIYRKVVLERGRMVGAILVNGIDRAGVMLALMKKRVDVTEFTDHLLKEDFGLVYVPKAVRERELGVTLNGIAK